MIELVFEFLGTLIFFFVILNVGQPIAIAAAFLGAVFFAASISGAHFNPGVTFLMWLVGKIQSVTAIQYVISQLLAAATVVYLSRLVTVPASVV